MREADAHTIAHEPIASVDLMERAAHRAFLRILHRVEQGFVEGQARSPVVVVAGMGNNGGDGLVIARLLHAQGVPVRVLRIVHRPEASADHEEVLRRAREAGVPLQDIGDEDLDRIDMGPEGIIVDALFGTGLDRPLHGCAKRAVQAINASGRPVVSIDMPSGLFTEDNSGNDPGAIVRATWTISFQCPKLAFMLPENGPYCGDWEVIDIGLDPGFLHAAGTPYRVVEHADVLALLPTRGRFDHKGVHGHALLLAGAQGTGGAAVLAARGALRSGAGLVSTAVPNALTTVLHVACPEAMCRPDPSPERITACPPNQGYTAIGAGPGMGTHDETAAVLKRLLQDPAAPLVLDADALNLLALEPTWLAFLPHGTILTPHPGELDRLHGSKASSGFDRLQHARALAMRTGAVVVLKGAFTATITPTGKVFFNPTGNPGMAKGGSGDVLTGLLTGLRAQGMPPLAAALLGVYLHGLAGDLAARHHGMDGMTALDIAQALPEAWKELRNASEEVLHRPLPLADDIGASGGEVDDR